VKLCFLSQIVSMIYHIPKLNSCLMIYHNLIIMTTAYRRRTGRSPPCVNSDNTDYGEHRMRTIYVRSSMAVGGGRPRSSRSMLQLGYFCFKCQQFWTDDDQALSLAEAFALGNPLDILFQFIAAAISFISQNSLTAIK
jgi:hypothetical protein